MKSNPIGVRFDLEKAAELMEQLSLETYQSLVSHLIDKAYGELDIPTAIVSIKDEKPISFTMLPPKLKEPKAAIATTKAIPYIPKPRQVTMPSGLSIAQRIDWMKENNMM